MSDIQQALDHYSTEASLAAKLRAAEGLAVWLESYVDNDSTPEANCSCHISPPCGDCVDFGGDREIKACAKRALSAWHKANQS